MHEPSVDDGLAEGFVCRRCGEQGAHVECLTMVGTGLSLLFELQPYPYAFVPSDNCGYTETYDLRALEGRDDLGTFLEVLFAG